MIIIFNWKDKTPKNYQKNFQVYQKIAQNVFLIICPNNDFFKTIFSHYNNFKIKYGLQKPSDEMLQSELRDNFDYVMINHQRYKESFIDTKVMEIINLGKIPIICFSSINEINIIKNINNDEVIWAYEPEKNIGSTKELNIDEIVLALAEISKLKIKGKLLYGGGIRNDNFAEVYQKIINLVDGLLIGDKSIDQNFLETFNELLLNIGKHPQNIV